jgi:NhaP-type Na+/H+ or K+/H+ antiporter
MDLTSIAIIVAGFLLFALISGRLEGTIITAPLVFMIFGFAVGGSGLGVVEVDASHEVIHIIAELTLILVLTADASRLDMRRLKTDHNVPVRMLAVGLPGAIALGVVFAMWLFPAFTVWEAALLAALLAPTDAALGQAVVSAKEVPVRIRQAINVESGLNDGIALPAVLLFSALASAQVNDGGGEWVQFALMQVGLGPMVGIALGYLGARALDFGTERGWVSPAFQGIGILSYAILTYVVSELVGGNGFIAAFVGGLVFGSTLRHPCEFLFEFMETEGQLLMLITFFIFGAVLLPEGLNHLDWTVVGYSLLSLTVIRMLPIALSLFGTGLRLPTQLFLGWFGPRGLASILFVLLILERTEIVHRHQILTITLVTVAMSTLLHGLTAAPFARIYGAVASRMGECEETQKVPELPLRNG